MVGQKRKLQGSERFDPFTDRTARDIRNTLSEAFVSSLTAMNPAEYLTAARRRLEKKLTSLYADYIDDRLRRYDRVIRAIRQEAIGDPLQQALVIWNQRLFFEFHDHLEKIWQAAKGDQRPALKGLIKAAGVYIHMEQHHRHAAKSLAMKSYQLLRQYPHCLAFIANYETLLEKLKSGDPAPPHLDILRGDD